MFRQVPRGEKKKEVHIKFRQSKIFPRTTWTRSTNKLQSDVKYVPWKQVFKILLVRSSCQRYKHSSAKIVWIFSLQGGKRTDKQNSAWSNLVWYP